MLPQLKKINIAPDTVQIYEKFKHLPFSFILDSAMQVDGLARFSFVSAEPFLSFRSTGRNIELLRPAGEGANNYLTESFQGNPFQTLRELLSKYTITRIPGKQKPVPFVGGAVGYFAYDLGRQIENIPDSARNDVDVPDCWLGFYDSVVAVDHLTKEVYLIATGLPEKGPGALTLAKERLAEMERLVLSETGPEKSSGDETNHNSFILPQNGEKLNRESLRQVYATRREDYYFMMETPGLSSLHTDFSRADYCAMVDRGREYIAAGDIFQVNLSQRFSMDSEHEPWQVYKRLREINPSPMMAFLNYGDLAVASASPERFLKVTDRTVETRPIKGTRPRGRDMVEDQHWRSELWKSEKDRAELVMIVDLERNDLGRVCSVGSVRVPELYRIEEYATVFHLVSTVVGELDRDKELVDLLMATFPGGSITGAPKIRAMEIIDELEPVRRGIYCGSIGYLGFDGDADLNIVIRTLVFTGGKIYFQVGGGITIDSDPQAEYLETLDKARALVRALGL